MTVQTDFHILPTTQQKEWHYIYFKKVTKVLHIISHFKNDTISNKEIWRNTNLQWKDVLGLLHIFMFIRLFTKSDISTLSWWFSLTRASISKADGWLISIADGWLKSTCIYSYAQSHISLVVSNGMHAVIIVLMVCMLLSLFLLLWF